MAKIVYNQNMANNLSGLAKLIRYYSLTSTTAAGSGHPTSSLSAADVMAALMFGGFFKADLWDPEFVNNDRLIFSKGHASPLFYSLYAVAGQASTTPSASRPPLLEKEGSAVVLPSFPGTLLAKEGEGGVLKRAIEPEELLTLRKMGSRLEGHPTMLFPYTEVPTGSLGQGLSVGVGMALNAKLDKLSYRTFVLLGDSEMAEGSVWEAMASASFYKLNNLVAILDCNRLGQSRETMVGHHTEVYRARAEAFGWNAIVIDGHNIDEIKKAFDITVGASFSRPLLESGGQGQPLHDVRPTIIIAKTLKGKGVSFIEDKPGKHGVALKPEELEQALAELGPVDKTLIGEVARAEQVTSDKLQVTGIADKIKFTEYPKDQKVATRKAYGNALVNIYPAHPNMVVLDGETSNSTFAETFAKAHPDRYFEMFIAEQNMAGVASGFSRRGKIPFASTFAAFWSRAFDQIRMSQYAFSNIYPVKSQTPEASADALGHRTFNGVKFVGSHAGSSIGEDGSSQMALEDIAMFRTNLNGVVLYPSDAVSMEKLVAAAAAHKGNVYIRSTRKDTAILYSSADEFPIGGSKTIRSSDNDKVTVIGAGVTLHEALAAHLELQKEGVNIRVIDLYSIKPIDIGALQKAAKETKAIITVEDHFPEGGIGEAVTSALFAEPPSFSKEGVGGVHIMAVRKEPHSGKPDEIMAYEEIDKNAIIKKVKELI
jgi:transketolase